MPQLLLHKLSSALKTAEISQNPDQVHRVIVEFNHLGLNRITNYIQDNSGVFHKELKLIRGLVVELPYEAIQAMTISNHVRRIWKDRRVQVLLDLSVPVIGGTKAFESGYKGKGTTAAVIDTGIHPHTDLTSPENRIVGWLDLVNQRTAPYDDNGHGTHVAGIIAGNGSSSSGYYQGVAPEANLVGVKALDQAGSGNTSDIITALEWCVDHQTEYNIKAINLSLGSEAQESSGADPLCRAVNAVWNRGIVVCAAAGNSGPNERSISSPGITPSIITVGNLDTRRTLKVEDDQVAESSSRGPTIDNYLKPDLLAPGTSINSLRVPMGYRALTGTSMATPFATGVALLYQQKNSKMRPDEVKRAMVQGARSLNMEAVMQGAGALDVSEYFTEKNQSSKGKTLSKTQLSQLAFVLLFPMALGF